MVLEGFIQWDLEGFHKGLGVKGLGFLQGRFLAGL